MERFKFCKICEYGEKSELGNHLWKCNKADKHAVYVKAGFHFLPECCKYLTEYVVYEEKTYVT